MQRLPALFAALLLPAAQPLLLCNALSTGGVLFAELPAQAQSAEAVAKMAEAITVRVEGATQGSGVLVKRDGNRYTVLTAWHVVSGDKLGEELDIYTPDGQRHKLEQGSIKRLGEVDMAVLSFSSPNAYQVSRVGDVKSISSGEQVLVAGFPAGSNGRLKYDIGRLVANAAVGIDQGYQLLYTNDTVTGMSGGVVLKADGTLIGMHGRGELDEVKSRRLDAIIKTGTNQGVPISYYILYDSGVPVVSASTKAITTDDFIAQARSLVGIPGNEKEVIRLSELAMQATTTSNPEPYYFRSFAYDELGFPEKALEDLNKAISINPRYALAFRNRGILYEKKGYAAGACNDWKVAGELGVSESKFWYERQCQ